MRAQNSKKPAGGSRAGLSERRRGRPFWVGAARLSVHQHFEDFLLLHGLWQLFFGV
ncbi:hypothetical protein [Methylobacterium sp. Leaf456]|uniref:hypothetical protein n=1 Tax=Methylobacterium sp. Leaf456 TaxID=1736382 RepID=UPI0012E33CD0|nr:hypothetical protein [Methylobacterium sp. Leaf456]